VLDLTSREIEILDHLSQGMSYKMVAAQLHLSIDTIRSHIKKIYEKLHVHSATEAINKVYIFRQNRQK
jgi:DNA-binding NarL/FixJ family response regulator